MKIRFLCVTDSAQPGFPFVPGQIITVPSLTPEVRGWLKPREDGTLRAYVVEDEPNESATVDPSREMATIKPSAKRTPKRGR